MGSFIRTPLFLWTGLKHFTKSGYLASSKTFDDTCMNRKDSLREKTCLVTGANQGLGFQISVELASRGSTLYMCCRNETRGKAALEKVKEISMNDDVHLILCDVSSLKDVGSLVKEWKESKRPLHVLVNNAGVLIHHDDDDGKKTVSVDGYEINFATNTLGVYALTTGLAPVLKMSASEQDVSRVIMVSSGGALTAALEVDDLEGKNCKSRDGSVYYARDKRRQIALAEYFNEEWKNEHVMCCSMHPGWVETEGVKSSIPGFYNAFKDKLRNLQQGADTAVWLCVAPQEDVEGGGFYLDRSPQKKHLTMGGTKYSKEELYKLVKRLNEFMLM